MSATAPIPTSAQPAARAPRAASTARGSLAVVLPALFIFAWFAVAPRALGDGDTFWHVAAGRWIVEHGAIPSTDPFSYTFAGKPWTAHEWLSEVLMYAAWRAAGWGGVAILCGAALAGACLALTRHLGRWLGFPAALIPLVFAASAILPAAYARPHVLGWALAIFWLLALIAARERDGAPRAHIAGIMLLWANIHGSFVFGLGLAGWFALEALVHADRGQRVRVIGEWARFGAFALLAALATPHGVEGLLFPLQLTAMDILPMIEEWRPAKGWGETALVLVPLCVALVPRLRVPPLRILLIAGLTFMAIEHLRHFALLAIIAAALLAPPVGRALGKAGAGSLRLAPAQAALVAVVLAGLAASALWRFTAPPESAHYPARALAAIPADLRTRPVFNGYSMGGPLIAAGVPVFIDGRADMYGDEFVRRYMAIDMRGDARAFEAAHRRWRFEWAFLPTGSRISAWLDRQPGWTTIYADRHATIHVLKARQSR